MDGRKKLSGAEYRRIAKEKRKKESDVLSLTPKLKTLFNKSNVNVSIIVNSDKEGSKEKSGKYFYYFKFY